MWLLLGPYGSAGDMKLNQEDACSRVHMCRGLSGVHLLPSLLRNLGVVLTARALRKIQEQGVVNRCDIEACMGRGGKGDRGQEMPLVFSEPWLAAIEY